MVAFFSPSSILHAVDRVGFLAEFGELAGGFVLELVDAHLEDRRADIANSARN